MSGVKPTSAKVTEGRRFAAIPETIKCHDTISEILRPGVQRALKYSHNWGTSGKFAHKPKAPMGLFPDAASYIANRKHEIHHEGHKKLAIPEVIRSIKVSYVSSIELVPEKEPKPLMGKKLKRFIASCISHRRHQPPAHSQGHATHNREKTKVKADPVVNRDASVQPFTNT